MTKKYVFNNSHELKDIITDLQKGEVKEFTIYTNTGRRVVYDFDSHRAVIKPTDSVVPDQINPFYKEPEPEDVVVEEVPDEVTTTHDDVVDETPSEDEVPDEEVSEPTNLVDDIDEAPAQEDASDDPVYTGQDELSTEESNDQVEETTPDEGSTESSELPDLQEEDVLWLLGKLSKVEKEKDEAVNRVKELEELVSELDRHLKSTDTLVTALNQLGYYVTLSK